ncbi:MAG TPA: 2-phospho-L-lactate transferase [Nevskiaceae bacterium]|nr:2-phospho-L-lactate transferase [Nevskiaceae bacterium]
MAGRVVALCGGVGGAKLALGLSRVLPADDLTIVVNTGDDFVHLGLHVSPDVDTVLYTLSGLADPVQGWGRKGETWQFMAALAALGGETWFRLGDADLALHVERTRRLAAGTALSAIVDDVRRRLGIGCHVVPMSDNPVRTHVETDEGWLEFQHYFVKRRCEPRVSGLRYDGALDAHVAPAALAALADPGVDAIVLCPSNPMLSIEPMLAVPGLRAAVDASAATVVAVSPIIGGRAVKGPTAKMMRELGVEASASAVAERYVGLVDAFVVDEADAEAALPSGMRRIVARTLMTSDEDKERVARAVLSSIPSIS